MIQDSDKLKLRTMYHWYTQNKSNLQRGPKITPAQILGGSGDKFRLAVMDVDINAGETQTATMWDGTTTPATDTGEKIELTFDYFSTEQISAGKQVGYIEAYKVGEPNRIILAECEDQPPPQAAQVATVNHIDIGTGTWDPIPGATTSYDTSTSFTAVPAEFGFSVQEPGYYQIVLAFSAESTSNNTTIGIRPVTGGGPGQEFTWEIKAAPGSVSGTFSNMYAVTQTEIDGGTIYLQVERNINNAVTWIAAELAITKQSGTPV